eukprot:12619442-Alexandrium_andersonii.AAC.1
MSIPWGQTEPEFKPNEAAVQADLQGPLVNKGVAEFEGPYFSGPDTGGAALCTAPQVPGPAARLEGVPPNVA